MFASDAMSSVAYAPEEIFLVLSVAGLTAYSMTPWIGLAVAFVMLVVVASYRQNVHAYPSGGGDYEVVTTNLGPDGGPDGGQRAAGGLRADRCGFDGLGDVQHRIGGAVRRPAQGVVRGRGDPAADAMNLRGIRESGTAFAIPTYAFIIGMFIMLGLGPVPDLRPGRSAAGRVRRISTMHAEHGEVLGFALVFLVARSFSSGCAALTGVEAISNGVPAFRKPKSQERRDHAADAGRHRGRPC